MARHAWINRLQTLLLILTLLGITALAGALLLGENGLWIALGASVLALLVEPGATSWLTLRLYRAQPLPPAAAPELWRILEELAARAALPAVPTPYYVPSPMVNAFAVGNRERAAIALTDGMLRGLSGRQITGVLAHEVAHIAHGDLRVMGLADTVSRLTSLFALTGLLVAFFALPTLFVMDVGINWSGLLLLAVSPHIALVVQLGLSRVREFDADRKAAELTGDPEGLASALARIEAVSRSWRRLLLPGWGNPEPSWLRTHPATDERIRRLRSQPAQPPAHDTSAPVWHDTDTPARTRHAPRWRIGGFWW
ncbi:zinc metalloprotease HtpX [Denitromonas iodatirespirans]|uniref:M48 family metalloprotease n=1 Tax=Denitromonas iodatirespirans TaxID=2795389 RepID=A0A944DGW7_DENI1|nr:zinc metalloprotease HtpX [Denitromonas iodatirespirans]MBT0963962.1 M48 family metalloprotease [Denitromonas iodatirespirans]